MDREPYWDYMGRMGKQLREENIKMDAIENDMIGLTASHYTVLQRLKEVTSINYELREKIAQLGGSGDPKQLELKF
jgi:hypothetical protein